MSPFCEYIDDCIFINIHFFINIFSNVELFLLISSSRLYLNNIIDLMMIHTSSLILIEVLKFTVEFFNEAQLYAE